MPLAVLRNPGSEKFPWVGIFFHCISECRKQLFLLKKFYRSFFTDLPACFFLLFDIHDLCCIIKWSKLHFLICGHGFILIPSLLKLACLVPPQKWHLATAMRFLLKQIKAGSWLDLKSLIILNLFGIYLKTNPTYVSSIFLYIKRS